MKPDDKSFLDRLRRLPGIRNDLAKTDADELKRRQCIVAEIERLDGEALVRLPAMRAEVEASLVEVKKAEKNMAAVYGEHNTKVAASSAASFEYQRLRNTAEVQLYDSPAKEAIDDFRRKVFDRIDEARKMLASVEWEQTGLDGKAASHVASNAEQVNARVAALRAASDAAHALRFVADQSNLEGRLEALLANLPVIEKPVAPAAPPANGPAPADPLRLLPNLKGP